MSQDGAPETFVSFGALLRFLRVRARLAQRELAIATGYSEAHLSRLEQGQRRPDPDVVRARIIPALGLEPASPLAERLLALSHAAPAAAPAPPPVAAARPAEAPDGLLVTKLARPQLQRNAVGRPQLLARLDAACELPLTLVAAPPGFGKTTLLTSWLRQLELRIENEELRAQPSPEPPRNSQFSILNSPPKAAWLSLDAGDNDPTLFVRYLVAALQTAAPGVGAVTLGLLRAAPSPLPTLLAPLINDLAALGRGVLLVFDDYHAIVAPAIHEAVAFLLERAPASLHLVISTRADPPLPLVRLRARGQLLELRAYDLRFDRPEAAAFLRTSMGLELADGEVAALEARTEGWAAGLQLAALALREQRDRARFVSDLAASSRYIADYLAEEVLDRLPSHLRQFLFKTSILDQLHGELCDAVLGLMPPDRGPGRDSYSQLLLDELERHGLFLIPLDQERRWYRYHHLFGEVLRARLRQGAGPDAVAELHRNAAAWHEGRGLNPAAIGHAAAAADWQTVARLVEGHGAAALAEGKHTTVRGWLEALPADVVRARPRLALFKAQIHNAAQELELADACLADVGRAAEAVPDPEERAALAREATVLGALVAVHRNDLGRAFALARQALDELPAAQPAQRAEAMLALGLAHSLAGELATAQQIFEDTWPIADAAGDLYTALYCQANQGVLALQQGHLLRADQIFGRALEFAERRRAGTLPVVGHILANYAELLCERNELDLAEEMARRAIEHSEQTGATRQLMIGLVQHAWVRLCGGDIAGAAGLLDRADRLVATSELPVSYTSLVSLVRVQLWLAAGEQAAAEGWARRRGLHPEGPIDNLNGLEYAALARVLIAGGSYARADTLLDRLWLMAEASGRRWRMITILALRAVASRGAGDGERALAHLSAALDLAAGHGFVRTFVDEGRAMAELLREAEARHIHPAYCAQLLAAFP